MNIIQLVTLINILLAFVVYFVFKAEVEISLNKSFLLGFSYNDTDYSEVKEVDHVLQCAFVFIIIQLTWTESYEN